MIKLWLHQKLQLCFSVVTSKFNAWISRKNIEIFIVSIHVYFLAPTLIQICFQDLGAKHLNHVFIPLNKWQYKFYGRISSDGKYQSQVWDYYSESGELEPRSLGRGDPCAKTCPWWRRLSPAESDARGPGGMALFL